MKTDAQRREFEGFLTCYVEASGADNANDARDYILRHHSDNLIRWWIDNTPEWSMVGAQQMDMSEYFADALRGAFPTVNTMDARKRAARKRAARDVALNDLDSEYDLEATIHGILLTLGKLSNEDAVTERRLDDIARADDMRAGAHGR